MKALEEEVQKTKEAAAQAAKEAALAKASLGRCPESFGTGMGMWLCHALSTAGDTPKWRCTSISIYATLILKDDDKPWGYHEVLCLFFFGGGGVSTQITLFQIIPYGHHIGDPWGSYVGLPCRQWKPWSDEFESSARGQPSPFRRWALRKTSQFEMMISDVHGSRLDAGHFSVSHAWVRTAIKDYLYKGCCRSWGWRLGLTPPSLRNPGRPKGRTRSAAKV